MPDMFGDASGINNARRDDNSRLLWQTKIRDANPWEHRGTQTESESAPSEAVEGPAAESTGAPPTLIQQRDRLELHQHEPPAQNPFESLLRHRLHVDLPGHEEDQP